MDSNDSGYGDTPEETMDRIAALGPDERPEQPRSEQHARREPQHRPSHTGDSPEETMDRIAALDSDREQPEKHEQPFDFDLYRPRHEVQHERPPQFTEQREMPPAPSPAEAEAFLRQQAEAITNHEKQLQAASDQIDWVALKEHDPARYAAVKADFMESRRRVDEHKQQLRGAAQELTTSHQKQHQARVEKHLAQQRGELSRRRPELADDANKARLAKYLSNQGFTDSEVAQAVDARVIDLAWRAMCYDEGVPKSGQRGIRIRKGQPRRDGWKDRADAEADKRNLSPHSHERGAIRLNHLEKSLGRRL